MDAQDTMDVPGPAVSVEAISNLSALTPALGDALVELRRDLVDRQDTNSPIFPE